MPTIPEYQARDIPIGHDNARADPYALAAPGLALERAGQGMQRVAGEIAGLVEQHNTRAYNESLADTENTAYTNLETGMEEARRTGNFQGFAQRQLSSFDSFTKQQLDNAPAGISSRLERRFASMRSRIQMRSGAFEHQMGTEAAIAGIGQDIDQSGTGIYRDPGRFFDTYGRISSAIDAYGDQGLMNPEQRFKAKRQMGDTLAMAAIRGRHNAGDDDALISDIEKGRYDSFLTPQSLERLQPLLDDLKGDQLGRRYSPLGMGRGGGATSSQAVNSDIPPEGRALLDSIAAPESRGAYDVRYTPGGGTRFADLSKHPRIPEPGPQGPSTAAGRYQITGQTYDEFAPGLGIGDFQPRSQDALGWAIAQDAYKKQTGGDLLEALKAGKLGEVEHALRDSGRWTTADLSSFRANLAKYQGAAGGSAITVHDAGGTAHQLTEAQSDQYYGLGDTQKQDEFLKNANAAAGTAPADRAAPDLDKAIAAIDATPGYSDKQKDRAIAVATRDYHHWRQATAQDRAQLESDVKDGIAALADGRNWTPDPAAIRRLLPAEQADQALRAIDEAKELGNLKNRVWFAAPADLNNVIAEGQAMKNSPQGYARAERYNAQLARVVKAREEALAADPAGYAKEAPAVAQAWAKIDAQNPDPAALQGAVAATLAEEARLGVPEEKRAALPVLQAGAIARQIAATDPEKMDMGAALDGLSQTYGAHWPRVFADLVKAGLPREAQMLGAMDRPDQAAARTDYQRMLQLVAQKGGSEALKRAAPHDAVQAIGQGIDDRLADFRATVRDPQLYDAVKSGVDHLAMYYAFKGMPGDQALAAAYDGMIARKYDFDGRVRAPKGAISTVERAGDVLVNQISADQLPDIGGNKDLTPADRRGIYLDAIRRGEWATNEDDSGIVRMARFRDGALVSARRADGSRIEIKFSDAARLAAGSPMPVTPYTGP